MNTPPRPLTDYLFHGQNGRCFWCDTPMAAGPVRNKRRNGWTREHVIPVALGGKREGNIVLAHKPCNAARGTRPVQGPMLADALSTHAIARFFHTLQAPI